jgi:uncharacterized protein (DUF427 family)
MIRLSWKYNLFRHSELTILQGNHYFPRSTLEEKFIKPSNHSTHCFWKGDASYYDLTIGEFPPNASSHKDGETNKDAVWYYAAPLDGAQAVKDRVAFWKGVNVVE